MTAQGPDFRSLDELEEQWCSWSRGRGRGYLEPPVEHEPWFDERREETADAWARRLHRRKLWYQLACPDLRGFFHACRAAMQQGNASVLQKWLRPDGLPDLIVREADFPPHVDRSGLPAILRAHLRCALAALAPEHWPATGIVPAEALEEIQQASGLAAGFLRDLAAALCDLPLSREAELTITVLLLDGRNEGTLATLVLESVAPGAGDFYPEPALALVARDAAFRKGETSARQFVAETVHLRDDKRDVRWGLRPRGQSRLPATIVGPSASAALGLLWTVLRSPGSGREGGSDAWREPDRSDHFRE